MIVLDTHIWIWWVHGDAQLPADYKSYIQSQEIHGLGVSTISIWEVAKRTRLSYFLGCCEAMYFKSHLSLVNIFTANMLTYEKTLHGF